MQPPKIPTFACVFVFLLAFILAHPLFAQDVITATASDAMEVCTSKHPASAGPCANPPHVTGNSAAQYSEQARKARREGTVVLKLVVGDDGKAHDIEVAKSLGMGLDEQAISAVQRWKFEPGTYEGKAVPVQISVEVAFHLYSKSDAGDHGDSALKSPASAGQDSDALEASARAAYNEHNYRLAANLSRQLTEVSPQNRNAWSLLGMALLELNQFDDAVEALKKQIEIDPRSLYAYNNLGRVYWRQIKFDEAVKAFKTQIEINPNDSSAHTSLGLVLRDTKNYTAAVPELEKALAISPNSAAILMGLAECNLNLGNNEKALEDLNRATSLASSAGTWNDAAYQLASHNLNLDRAKQWAETAARISSTGLQDLSLEHLSPPQIGQVGALSNQWDTLGWIYFLEGNASMAEPYLRAAWALSFVPVVGNHLAQTEEKAGRRDEAIRDYSMVLASADANRNMRGLPETLSEVRDRLAKLLGSNADFTKLTEKGRSDLTAMQTVEIPNSAKLNGAADFAILISTQGKVSDVRQVSGDAALKPLANALRSAPIGVEMPPAFYAPVVRRGTLTCVPNQPQCKFVLLTIRQALDKFRVEQFPETAAPARNSSSDPHTYSNAAMGVRMRLPDGWRLFSEKHGSFSQPSTTIFTKPGTIASILLLQEHLESPPELYRKMIEAILSKQDDFSHTADEDIKRDGIPGTRWRASWKVGGVTYKALLEFFTEGDQHYRVFATAPVEVFPLYLKDFEEALTSVQFPGLHPATAEAPPVK